MLLLFALALILSPLAHGWCINSPRQLVNCADSTSSSTVGCYAYSQCAATQGNTFTGSISTMNGDTFSAFLVDAANFANYQAGTSFTCFSGFGSCVSGAPTPGTSAVSISGSWTASSTYYLVIECDNSVVSCQLAYNFDLNVASSTSAPTSSPTSPPPATTAAPAPAPGDVTWAGSYAVQSGCDQATCCCLTGTVVVTQSGLSVAFSGAVVGQCGGSSTFAGSSTLSALSSSTASFTFLGEQFIATRSGNTVNVANQQAPQCSGSATCTSGACFSSTTTTSAAVDAGSAILLPALLLGYLVAA